MKTIDAITYEVIRHKLWSIADEQAIALMAVSGSSVVTDSRDFNNGIYLNDGSTVVFGRQMLRHAGTMSLVLKSVIKECKDDPGIEEGDMFIMNNPYQGAIHLPDVAVVAPYFHKGKCLAWFGACAHQLDVGGMEAGSLCPHATERFQEGLTISPLKLVQKGKLRKDIFNMILSNSRLPFLLGLDIHALISSNEVAKKRFSTVIDKYGSESIAAVMEESLDLSEKKLRQRLMELPDGIFQAVDFLDNPSEDKIYKLALTVEKKKDSLVFDFSGTSTQAPHCINTTESVTIGGVLSIVLTTLAYDIPWNHGISRPLTIKIPKGTICNASPPAAVSQGVASTGQSVNNVALAAINKMLSCNSKYRSESGALGGGFFIMINLKGLNQYGEPFGTSLLDSSAGASAYYDRDGFGLGSRGIPVPAVPNIETNENIAPILYLYRHNLKDGGGPGKYRGATPLRLAFTPHNTQELKFIMVSHGVKVPSATGMFGGYPGACNAGTLLTDSNLLQMQKRGDLPGDIKNLKGEITDLADPVDRNTLRPGDVMQYSRQGGGGYGSARDRDPQKVAEDVSPGIVSTGCAEGIYGVLLKNGKVDEAGTARLRGTSTCEKKIQSTPLILIGLYLNVLEDNAHKVVKCCCGYSFGDANSNWKLAAAQKIINAEDTGPFVRLHRELEMREYACPGCGKIHWVEVMLKGEPPLQDISLE